MSAFTQGLSGLRADQKAIEVTSNNIANSNAVGFKSSRAQFGDVYNSLYFGGSTKNIGKGTSIMDVDQQFTQGSVVPTGNPLDLAISGDGFFKVRTTQGAFHYTRAGMFGLDPNGFVENSSGDRLQMFPLDPNTGNPINTAEDMVISDAGLPPSASTEAAIRFNLDARDKPAVNSNFDPLDSTTYNSSSTVVLYDELGRKHNLNLYWTRVDGNPADAVDVGNQWQVRAQLDGVPVDLAMKDPVTGQVIDPASFADNQSLNFTPVGALVDSTAAAPNTALFEVDLSNWIATNGRFSESGRVDLDMRNSTQFGAGFVVQDIAQDGYEAANFTGFKIEESGRVVLNYSNGETKDAGVVSLFRFRNPDGLVQVGENKWQATPEAGAELTSLSEDSAFANIIQGSLEESNVDLTEELVKLITFQRSYQANSQSIKTQDALLQTATNLRNG